MLIDSSEKIYDETISVSMSSLYNVYTQIWTSNMYANDNSKCDVLYEPMGSVKVKMVNRLTIDSDEDRKKRYA